MGYASVIAACLAWLIVSDLFNWHYRVPIGAIVQRIFQLRGDAAAFVGIPLLWLAVALLLASLIASTWAVVARSNQRWIGTIGLALAVTLIVVGTFEFASMATARRDEQANPVSVLTRSGVGPELLCSFRVPSARDHATVTLVVARSLRRLPQARAQKGPGGRVL